MIVQKWYRFSKNRTSNFDLFPSKQHAVWSSVVMLGGTEPSQPHDHRGNDSYPYNHSGPRQPFCFYFQNMRAYSVAQSCPTLCDPMDCGPPGSSVNGISEARILEWVAISFSRGSFWPRDRTHISSIGGWISYHWATREIREAQCYYVLSVNT